MRTAAAEVCLRVRMQLYERDSHRHRGYSRRRSELGEVHTGGKKAWEIEKNGQYYQCQCTPVYYSGRLRGYILGAWILPARKETQLMQALKGKQRCRRRGKSDFLAQMSHDPEKSAARHHRNHGYFKQPQELTASDRALLLHIKGAGNSLVEQVNAILDYSRIEAGKFELAAERYRLDQVLEEVLYVCHQSAVKAVRVPEACIQENLEKNVWGCMRVREILESAHKCGQVHGGGRDSAACDYLRQSGILCDGPLQGVGIGAGMTSEQLGRDLIHMSYAARRADRREPDWDLAL